MSVDTTFEENTWFSDLFGIAGFGFESFLELQGKGLGPVPFVGCGEDEMK